LLSSQDNTSRANGINKSLRTFLIYFFCAFLERGGCYFIYNLSQKKILVPLRLLSPTDSVGVAALTPPKKI
jgi:hypothetical protein